MNALSDYDRQRLEDLNALIRDDLEDLKAINQRQSAETRRLEKRLLAQDAAQVRQSYNEHREEYANLLRKEIPTRFASEEQAFILTVVEQLNTDQLALTRTALQEADHDPTDPELAQISAEVVAVLPSVQQQLAAKNMPAANHLAQVAQVIQAPTADLKQKLKLSIPLIPLFLYYETEFNLNITANIKAAWERLTQRFRPQ